VYSIRQGDLAQIVTVIAEEIERPHAALGSTIVEVQRMEVRQTEFITRG